MTTLTSRPANHGRHQASTTDPESDEALGWEGHVTIPNAPILTKLLNNWPELRTGLAFSMVFVVGAIVGGTLLALLGGNKKSANE